MGNSIACLASRAGSTGKVHDSGLALATGRLSPSPSLPRRTSGSFELRGATLQDVCVGAVASATLAGSLDATALSDLPLELLQRVLDAIISSGAWAWRPSQRRFGAGHWLMVWASTPARQAVPGAL